MITHKPWVLGVSALFHDSAAALVCGQDIVAAAQEERFTRIKGDAGFPDRAIEYCLSQLPEGAELDALAYFEDPVLKLDRIIGNAVAMAPAGGPNWPATLETIDQMANDLPARLLALMPDPARIYSIPHHRSHAASAFRPSGLDEAAILVVDGVGEWSTCSIWSGRDGEVEPVSEIRFPQSLGLFYSAFTQFCGFKVNSGEYKLMGLASMGKPALKKALLGEVIHLNADGSFSLNMKYFAYRTCPTSFSPALPALLGYPPRTETEPLSVFYKNLAASVQSLVDDAMVGLAAAALRVTGSRNLCLAGGVALNCVANSQILGRVEGLERMWIQPAAGDAGGALGAALEIAHRLDPAPSGPARSSDGVSQRDSMHGALLGPQYSDAEIEDAIVGAGLVATHHAGEPDLLEALVSLLASGAVVGHFNGRMEFGPRALGNRSILADPRPVNMKQIVNRKIKFREGWRPFAPVVLADDARTLFAEPCDSPYMLMTTMRRDAESAEFPAITHFDGSSRLQTVASRASGRIFDLLEAFKARTGCPMLLNTSFNVRGEPIVCTPRNAVRCFLNTNMDALAIGGWLILKSAQGDWVQEHINRMEFDAD
jgi:carbamoyltransferase